MKEKLEQSAQESAKENAHELATAAHEQQERLENDVERRAEKDASIDSETLAEKARETAEKLAEDTEKVSNASPAEKRKPKPLPRSKEGLDASFNITMKGARAHMSSPSRVFSKVIHNKAVERISDAVGTSVARPNAILSGSAAAFILTLSVYLVARFYGYPLSGFETIGAFILGWVLGNIFDYLRIMITGKKS